MTNATLNTPKMLTAALYYAGEGFPVFPVRENIKDPATKNGFKDGLCTRQNR